MAAKDERIKRVDASIARVQDFPKKGILFRDIFPLFQDPTVFTDCCTLLTEYIQEHHGSVDVIVGLEARGFLFAPTIAVSLNAAFVPIRKAGKLPGECIQISYKLEYGEDKFEVQKGSIKPGQTVVIVDDLLATGGTMSAACSLIQKAGGDLKQCLCIIELEDLNGRSKVPKDVPLYTLVQQKADG